MERVGLTAQPNHRWAVGPPGHTFLERAEDGDHFAVAATERDPNEEGSLLGFYEFGTKIP
jgi:hypothetical protein